jgi:hypothetical protein
MIALAEVTEFSKGEFSSAYFLDKQLHTDACESAWQEESTDDDLDGVICSTAGFLAGSETHRFSIQASALEQRSGESPGLGVISPRSGLNQGDDLCSVQ